MKDQTIINTEKYQSTEKKSILFALTSMKYYNENITALT